MGLYGKYEGLPWEDKVVASGRVRKPRQLYLLLPVFQETTSLCVQVCVCVRNWGGWLPRNRDQTHSEKNENDNLWRGRKGDERKEERRTLRWFDKRNVKRGGEMKWSGVEILLWHRPVSTPSSHLRALPSLWRLQNVFFNNRQLWAPCTDTLTHTSTTPVREAVSSKPGELNSYCKEMRKFMFGHAHTRAHTQILTHERSHQRSQQIGSRPLYERGLKERSFDKESVFLSPLDKTKAYAH